MATQTIDATLFASSHPDIVKVWLSLGKIELFKTEKNLSFQ